jgi:CTP:molybdopterin cytidylyltransferase MocA
LRRWITLPAQVGGGGIRASVDNGVLKNRRSASRKPAITTGMRSRWRGCLAVSGLSCLGGVTGDPCTVPSAFTLLLFGELRMAEAPQLPPDPLISLPRRAEVVQPDPPLSQLPRVGVVLAAGRSERLESVTGGGSKALLRLGGLSLVERAVRTLLARGLERVLVVVGHDAGPVAAVVGRRGRGRVRAVYADRWRDGNGASLAAVHGAVAGEALFVLVTADHVLAEGALDRLLGTGAPAVLVDAAPDRAAWGRGPGCESWTRPWSPSASTWRSQPSTAARSCSPPRCSAASARRPPRATTPWPAR